MVLTALSFQIASGVDLPFIIFTAVLPFVFFLAGGLLIFTAGFGSDQTGPDSSNRTASLYSAIVYAARYFSMAVGVVGLIMVCLDHTGETPLYGASGLFLTSEILKN